MKRYILLLLPCFLGLILLAAFSLPKEKKIFNGHNLAGWEGDTTKIWRVEDQAIVGGSLTETVAHNYFLCTKQTYADFHLRLKFKLSGTEGFVNTGVQFRSKRAEKPDYEMIGYQADLGDGYWASLYDESRRNKTLIGPDSAMVAKILKPGTWNNYELKCEGRHIQIFLNGVKTVDYFEADTSIPQSGLIGLQIHGGGKAQVYFKDIWIRAL